MSEEKGKPRAAEVQYLAGQRAESAGDIRSAERHFLTALEECKQATDYPLRITILKTLGDLYSKERNAASAESAYRGELNLLLQYQRGIDLRVGTALFDLQSVFEATARYELAESTFKRAVEFYTDCMKKPGLADACNRQLADVEGLRGASLFNLHRYADAEPFLKNVVARKDDSVRPETMIAALMAYETILALRGDAIAAQRCLDRLNRIQHPNSPPN